MAKLDGIDIEDYKKLKQLDRIEFLLRREQTKEHDNSGSWISAFIDNARDYLHIILWLLLAYPIYKLAFGDKIGNKLMFYGAKIMTFTGGIVVLIYILCVLMAVISSRRFKKARENLYTEYFKTEPNK